MSSHTVYKDIPYTITDHHPRQILDLYVPRLHSSSLSDNNLWPLIVYIHGGAFKFGSKESEFLPLRQIDHGYAIAAINYRRSGEAIFPAMIQDGKSAIRFLKSSSIAAKYRLNPEKVIVWGESAGGHAAAFLGTTSVPDAGGRYDVGDYLDISSSVVGAVDYYGPTNFLEMDAHLPEGFQTHNDADSPESLYLGEKITNIPEKVHEADPRSYIEEMVSKHTTARKGPEFFIAHGTVDRIVPEHMSRLLTKSLEQHSVRHEYVPVEGTDHGFVGINNEQQRHLDERTDAFLKRLFRNKV